MNVTVNEVDQHKVTLHIEVLIKTLPNRQQQLARTWQAV